MSLTKKQNEALKLVGRVGLPRSAWLKYLHLNTRRSLVKLKLVASDPVSGSIRLTNDGMTALVSYQERMKACRK
jgi:hypothetical protein